MFALRNVATTASSRLPSTALPLARRQASTVPRAFQPPHYSLKERFTKFVPTEAYPLITFVLCMTTFGLTYGLKAFKAVPGELRLTPARYQTGEEEKPWESERALAGKW